MSVTHAFSFEICKQPIFNSSVCILHAGFSYQIPLEWYADTIIVAREIWCMIESIPLHSSQQWEIILYWKTELPSPQHAVMQEEVVLLHDCIVPCGKFWMYASFRWWAEYSKGLGRWQIEIFTVWNTKYETRQSFKKLAFSFKSTEYLFAKFPTINSYYQFLY